MTALAYRLNKRITIQAPPTAQDAYGEPTGDWTNVFSTPDGKIAAEIKDVSGRQYVVAQAAQNPIQTEITIRVQAENIEAKMRALHGTDIYDIQAVLIQHDRTLLLMCVKGVSNG